MQGTVMAKKQLTVIGAGISGLSIAALMAKEGFAVRVLEKNEQPGGRARVHREQGFTFDMGPTWYLMPEIFERFFAHFDKKVSDYYELEKLSPYFRVFTDDKVLDISSDPQELKELFASLEENGAEKLEKYLKEAKYKYEIAVKEFLYKDFNSIFDFMNKRMIFEGLKLHVFSKLDKYAKKFFKSPLARKILEYNIVFLGGSPDKSPALYSLMSHVDLNLGVWYPKGGIWKLPDALYRLCLELGVTFHFNEPAVSLVVEKNQINRVHTDKTSYATDLVISGAEYPHVETVLLPKKYQTYSEKYWKKGTYAPSMFLIYLGLSRKIPGLAHHNFYFPDDWDPHFKNLFSHPAWPENPAYYIGVPSVSDPLIAPPGKELLFMLVPVAPGLDDNDTIRQNYTDKILSHFEGIIKEPIRPLIEIQKIFSHRDFKQLYHAYDGTALGLAHTLFQTAIFRPGNQSKKVKNLFFTGQYTNPGIGVPMALISSEIVMGKIKKARL